MAWNSEKESQALVEGLEGVLVPSLVGVDLRELSSDLGRQESVLLFVRQAACLPQRVEGELGAAGGSVDGAVVLEDLSRPPSLGHVTRDVTRGVAAFAGPLEVAPGDPEAGQVHLRVDVVIDVAGLGAAAARLLEGRLGLVPLCTVGMEAADVVQERSDAIVLTQLVVGLLTGPVLA